MAKKKVVDAESAIEDMKNKKFGLSIQNIIALVTVLSTGIAVGIHLLVVLMDWKKW